MKVFVSWSGKLSHTVAEAFAVWLPTVIQECRTPFVSSDLAKGEAWFQAITLELSDSKIGVAFITNENHASPWLHFEGGAMLTELQTQSICPVVVDLTKADYDGPLKNLQLTDLSDGADFFKLLKTINSACDHPLDPQVLRDTFDLRWPNLEEQVTAARASSEDETPDAPKVQRTQDEKIDEILGLVREFRFGKAASRKTGSLLEDWSSNDLRRYMGDLVDGQPDWSADKIKQFIAENGNIVNDKVDNIELGTLVDMKLDSKGATWVKVEKKDGEQIALPISKVSITPF
jgi:TIR domain